MVEVEENKKNTGFIVAIIILAILVVGLVGYVVYDKMSNNNDKNQESGIEDVTNKENDNNSNIDDNSALGIADLIVKSYYDSSKTLFDDVFSKGLDDNMKALIAIRNTTGVSEDCDDLYKNSGVKKFTGGEDYQIDYNGNEIGVCETNAEAYKYDDVNDSYKKLFGQSQNVAKNKIVMNLISYDFVNDKFVKLQTYGGTDSRPISVYKVASAKLKDGILTVQVLYKRLELEIQDDGYLYYKEDKFNDSTLDNFINNFADKYKSDMDTYEMVFKLESAHYILESVIKK